jgi:hypothetical protein
MSEDRSRPANDWPAPHPTIDAPYGPRYTPPEPPAPTPYGTETLRRGLTGAPADDWWREPLPRPEKASTKWVVFFVVGCLLVAAIGAFLAARFVTTSRYPKDWDERIEPIAAFVEQAAGKTFAHPVEVEFLTDEDFEGRVTRDKDDLSVAEQQAISTGEATGRALGWYSGTTDVFAATNETNAAAILAYYSFQQTKIVARTSDPSAMTLSPSLRVTLAHELTHALQDQRFEVRQVRADAKDEQSQNAVTALIEGHAVLVENHYYASLSDADRATFDEEYEAGRGAAEDRIKDVPAVLTVPLTTPYTFGPIFVETAESPSGVEDLYEQPPVAMDQILDPRAYNASDTPEKLDAPTAKGTLDSQDTAGPVLMYLTLATAVSPQDAWTAIAGWGNDRYSVGRDDSGLVCVEWNVVGDTPDATSRLATHLDTWAKSRPAAAKATVVAGSPILVSACDPGTTVEQAVPGQPAVEYFRARAVVLDRLMQTGAGIDKAACATDQLFVSHPPAELVDPSEATKAEATSLLDSCA